MNTIPMNQLLFWHEIPCDYLETPGGLCKLLGVASLQFKSVVDTYKLLKEKHGDYLGIPHVERLKKLGKDGIYNYRDNKGNPIIIKKQGAYTFLSEGYHRVLTLLSLGETELMLDFVQQEQIREVSK